MPNLQRYSLKASLLLTLVPALLSTLPLMAQAQSSQAEALRNRLEYAATGTELVVGSVRLHTGQLMLDIYADTDFALAWTRAEQFDGRSIHRRSGAKDCLAAVNLLWQPGDQAGENRKQQ